MGYAVITVSVVLIVVGSLIAVVGCLGLAGRLPRNRFAGIRTPATLRSDEAFTLANRVGGLPIVLGGAIAVLSGIVGLLINTIAGAWIALALGLIGLFALTVIGGVTGTRAAAALSDDTPSSCAGCACGGCGS